MDGDGNGEGMMTGQGGRRAVNFMSGVWRWSAASNLARTAGAEEEEEEAGRIHCIQDQLAWVGNPCSAGRPSGGGGGDAGGPHAPFRPFFLPLAIGTVLSGST
jgi:hypothetical protein